MGLMACPRSFLAIYLVPKFYLGTPIFAAVALPHALKLKETSIVDGAFAKCNFAGQCVPK